MKERDLKKLFKPFVAIDIREAKGWRRRKRRWGPWTLDLGDGALVYQRSGMEYFVPIDGMYDSAQILDWIFHLNEASWASRADVGYLVEAIEHVLGREVASCGVDHPIDPRASLAALYGISF